MEIEVITSHSAYRSAVLSCFIDDNAIRQSFCWGRSAGILNGLHVLQPVTIATCCLLVNNFEYIDRRKFLTMPHQKCSIPKGNSHPYRWATPVYIPNYIAIGLSVFCMAHVRNKQTNRLTYRQTTLQHVTWYFIKYVQTLATVVWVRLIQRGCVYACCVGVCGALRLNTETDRAGFGMRITMEDRYFVLNDSSARQVVL